MTALADRCPVCGTRRNAPPVEPHSAKEDRGMIIARYKCPDCRCKWFVCWDKRSLEEAA